MKNESGATAIEYGLIAAGIAVAIIAVVHGPWRELEHDLWNRPNCPQIALITPGNARALAAYAGAFWCSAEGRLRRPCRGRKKVGAVL
jgi:hypothetical protein